MPDEMDEIIADFITEAEESLDRIDPLFIELDSKGFDREIINEIFRSMHTIKGAAGFLGFQQIVDVAHGSETILKKLREGEMEVSESLTAVILKSFDMVRLQLRHLKLKDGVNEGTGPLLRELEDALNSAQGGGKVPPQAAEAARPAEKTPAVQGPDKTASGNQCGAGKAFASSPEKAGGEKPGADKGESMQTLRIGIDKVDQVMNLTGEVVLIRNRLLNLMGELDKKYSDDPHIESLMETVSFLDILTSDMQLAVMKMRMQPLKKVFNKFPRLVKEISSSLGKCVELKISGENTEVDKSIIEQIGDPMVHIIRNAIDHGVESGKDRLAGGKPAQGTISINAYQKGNQIVIEVSDDGKGIDVGKVKRKALEKWLISPEEAQRLDGDSAVNLIFLPGLSTNDVATELSGRGVGMDVVKTNVSKLSGFIEVMTKKGSGTTLRMSLPLTLGIIHALMVGINGSTYAIPLALVDETLKISREEVHEIVDKKVLNVRGKVYPFFELSELLGNGEPSGTGHRFVIMVAIADSRFCIGVDRLLGLQEVVIKSITGTETTSPCILGATISGDGKVILIIDLGYISRSAFDTLRHEK